MRQLLRVTGEPPADRPLHVVRDLRVAITEITEKHGPKPEILYAAFGEDYWFDAMKRFNGPEFPPINRNWTNGGMEILGYPTYLDVDLPKRALQVVWTR